MKASINSAREKSWQKSNNSTFWNGEMFLVFLSLSRPNKSKFRIQQKFKNQN